MPSSPQFPVISSPETPGLYVHIPFCLSHCGYCTFRSDVYSPELVDRYLEAMEREYRSRAPVFGGRSPSTLFIGGGTPSCLDPGQLARLFSFLPMPEGGEASCELNPDSVTPETFEILLAAGINRVSFGVQTFDSEGLQVLGRRHNAEVAKREVERAVEAGFASVSLDLIMGWPGQTVEMLARDLAMAVDLGVRHISCYQLIVEEGCRDYSELAMRLGDQPGYLGREYWDCCEEHLEGAGFLHYETSNYALREFFCHHNVFTWKGFDYLGLGLAAHSHIGGRRFANTGDMGAYLEESGVPAAIEVFSERLCGEEKARECAVFWLRLFEGVEMEDFRERTGYTFEELYGETYACLVDDGQLEMVEVDARRYVRVPKQYQPVLDSILIELV